MTRAMRIAAALGCVAAFLRLTPAAAADWGEDPPLVAGDGFATFLIDARSMRPIQAFPRQPFSDGMPSSPTSLENLLATREYSMLSPGGERFVVSPPHAAVDVWNVARQELDLRFPNSDAVAVLGAHGERVAVLRSRGPSAMEFAVWDVAARRRVFSRAELVFAGMNHHRIGSARFALYQVGPGELRIWDDARGSLGSVALPADFMVTRHIVASRDGQRIAVSAAYQRRDPPPGASSREIFVFDLPRARLVQRFDVGFANDPQVRGWTANGAYLIVQDGANFIQFDARTGSVAHRWNYVPAFGAKRDYAPMPGPWSGTPRGKLVGGFPAGSEAVLAPDGKLLVMRDPAWNSLVGWDVTVSPPRPLAPLCEKESCGAGWHVIAFSAEGRSAFLQDTAHGNALVVLDLAARQVRAAPVDTRALDAASRRAKVPALSLETCAWDPAGCLHEVRKKYTLDSSCAAGATPGCEEKRAWMKRACGLVPEEFCEPLWNIGRALHDEATMRAGLSVHCEPRARAEGGQRPYARELEERVRKSCAPLEEPLGAGTEGALRADCDADVDYCWLAARVARRAKASTLAISLAQRGCESASRAACIEGGMAALDASQALRAQAFFEEACVRIDEPKCVEGLKRASALGKPATRPTRERGAAAEAAGLCSELRYLRIAGVRHFSGGAFDGVRVRAVLRGNPDVLPFAPGDVLLDTVGCPDGGCAPESFVASFQTACEIAPDRLLHDVELDVASATPKRNRKVVLRRSTQ